MTASTLLERLHAAHRGEVFGEIFYATAAKVARDPSRRAKWATLLELETRTRGRLEDALLSLGSRPAVSPSSRAAACAFGLVAGVAPWRFVLRALLHVARASTRRFEAWEREAPADLREVFHELAAHERAQCIFAESELAGDTRDSIRPVVELLGER